MNLHAIEGVSRQEKHSKLLKQWILFPELTEMSLLFLIAVLNSIPGSVYLAPALRSVTVECKRWRMFQVGQGHDIRRLCVDASTRKADSGRCTASGQATSLANPQFRNVCLDTGSSRRAHATWMALARRGPKTAFSRPAVVRLKVSCGWLPGV